MQLLIGGGAATAGARSATSSAVGAVGHPGQYLFYPCISVIITLFGSMGTASKEATVRSPRSLPGFALLSEGEKR